MKYRMLKKGEVTKEGDEFKLSDGTWIKATMDFGHKIDGCLYFDYRRPVSPRRKRAGGKAVKGGRRK